MPDLATTHQELKRTGVTLQLLWEEYREAHPEAGYSYSQFCEIYRRWAAKPRPSMRQQHRAGEKLFVDFSGKRLHRSISSPLAALLINRYSPRKAQAAYFALWLGSGKNSIPIVSDPVNTFNDAWAKEHMTAPEVIKAYLGTSH